MRDGVGVMGIPADLQRRQAARWRLLKAVYDIADGRTGKPVPMPAAYDSAGLEQDEGKATFDYLRGEGLLDQNTVLFLLLTHPGVKEVEEVLSNGGARGTEHFAAGTMQFVQNFNAPMGSVQTGGHGNTAHVSQTVGMASGDVLELTKQLHAKAEEHGDEDAIALAQKAHEHATAGKFEKVRMHVQGLTAIAALAPYAKTVIDALANVGF
jgi:hypothetical protein